MTTRCAAGRETQLGNWSPVHTDDTTECSHGTPPKPTRQHAPDCDQRPRWTAYGHACPCWPGIPIPEVPPTG